MVVDLALAGRRLDGVERREDALAHVVAEALLGVARVGVDPGDHEHGQALRHRPADEALLGVEVEDVELVDPGRHDQERAAQHRLGRRRVLDELDEIVAEHDLARRVRHVDPDLEALRVRLAHLELAAAGLDVLGEHLHAAHEIGAVLLDRRADELGVRGEEVRGRQRARQLPDVELGLVAGVLVEPFRLLDERLGPARGDEIGLLEEVEDRVLRPLRVLEAGILRIRRRDRGGGLALHPLQRRRPEVEEGRAEAGLRLDRLLRVDEPVLGDLAEGLDVVGGLVGKAGVGALLLERPEVGGRRLAGLLDERRHVARQLLDVRDRKLGLVLGRRLLHVRGAPPEPYAVEAGPLFVILTP